MPVRMSFNGSPKHDRGAAGSASTGQQGSRTLPFGTQNQHNMLGERPTVRQSKIYRQNESGNEMKSLLGVDHLSWDSEKQQGCFAGMAVHDARSGAVAGSKLVHPACAVGSASHGRGAGACAPSCVGIHSAAAAPAEVPYPLPGSSATCDGCGMVVWRYYHCLDCTEGGGSELFDVCTPCAAVLYLPPGSRPQGMPTPRFEHPCHNLRAHRMVQVVPDGHQYGQCAS